MPEAGAAQPLHQPLRQPLRQREVDLPAGGSGQWPARQVNMNAWGVYKSGVCIFRSKVCISDVT